MSSKKHTEQELMALFSDHHCWQLETLAEHLNYSIRSIQRFLNKLGYHRSFTHNGKWFTLYGIPTFNRDGLWFSKNDIGFSKAGNLNNTIITLIKRSSAGMTAELLGQKLHTRCHTLLVQLCRRGEVQREKVGRSYVYFAADHQIAKTQYQALEAQNLPSAPVPAEIAVLVFVEFIQNSEASFEQLASILKSKRKVTITAKQIEKVFTQYDVKKTPPTAGHNLYGH
ncbi:MAG TPA: BlaI/MecI/CopY family transcriptional regulator [Desulfohalobiaceae bacterium]|nr:BlaI/MecI/CopY family transcriptional regulator [Desulfohalobiaceae bacterium]